MREEEAAESRVAQVMADGRLVGSSSAFLLAVAAQCILSGQSRVVGLLQKSGYLGTEEEKLSSHFWNKVAFCTPQVPRGCGSSTSRPATAGFGGHQEHPQCARVLAPFAGRASWSRCAVFKRSLLPP